MSAAPALCRDARADAAVGAAIGRCLGVLRERLGPRLRGLVLTGSFARGEGTVVALDGRLRVLGDIEFLVIVPRGRDYRALRPTLGGWGRRLSAELAGRGLAVELEFGPAEEGYLRHRARPSIFVHDLRTHGRVVAGPPDLLARIPAFEPRDIPREDAVHLLFNRAIEQLDAWDRVDALDGEALLDVAYQLVKLRLDVAGSALAFTGGHVPSYAARPAAFAALRARTPALAALLPDDVEPRLATAARLKVTPDADALLPAGTAAAQRAWLRDEMAAAVPALAGTLRWELGRCSAATRRSPRCSSAGWRRRAGGRAPAPGSSSPCIPCPRRGR